MSLIRPPFRRRSFRPTYNQKGFIINPFSVVPSGPSKWNPSDKDSDITLSAGDTAASFTGATPHVGSVRGTLFNSAGIHYFQVTLTAGTDVIVGIGNASATITSYPGANTNSWGFVISTLQKITNGSAAAYAAGITPVVGDVIGVGYNATAGTISFYYNGINLGVAYSGISGNLYPMWGCNTSTAGTKTGTIDTALASFGSVYATWNVDDKDADIVLSNAYKTATWTPGTGFNSLRSTLGRSSGHYYCEVTLTFPGGGGDIIVGLGNASALLNNYVGQNANSWGYLASSGRKYNNGTDLAYGATYASGAVIGMDYDASTGTLVFYKNGVSQGNAYTGLSGTLYPMYANVATVAGNYVGVLNAGGSAFTGSLPSGSSAWGQVALPAGASAWG